MPVFRCIFFGGGSKVLRRSFEGDSKNVRFCMPLISIRQATDIIENALGDAQLGAVTLKKQSAFAYLKKK